MTIPPHTIFCTMCGQESEHDARFCPQCGASICGADKGRDALEGVELADGVRVVERIGTDALSRVFLGVKSGVSERVVVRVVHNHFAQNRRFIRGLRELSPNLLALSDPRIAKVFAVGLADLHDRQLPFVVEQVAAGRPLCEIVRDRGILPVPRVLHLGQEVLNALATAHRESLIHGELKSENIRVGMRSNGQVLVKVCDFGLASLAAFSLSRIGTLGASMATPLYRAPEVQESIEPTAASDIYSLGVILYEHLTGSLPFSHPSSNVVMRLHREEVPTPLRKRAPERPIGPATEAVVLRALAKSPTERWASAQEMREALARAAIDDEGVTVPVGSPARIDSCLRAKVIARDELIETVQRIALAPTVYGLADRGFPRGAAALILGGAGMGKSAVLSHVLSNLQGGPLAVFTVDGRRSLTRPLEPFIAWSRQLLGTDDVAEEPAIPDLVERLVHEVAFPEEDAHRLVDYVFGHDSVLRLPSDVLEREQAQALRSFVGHVVTRWPTVLVVENADSMDPASLRLVKDLVEAAALLPLSVLVSVRGDPWPEWKTGHLTRVRLMKVDEEGALAIVRGKSGGAKIDADESARIIHWAGGSPLLLSLAGTVARLGWVETRLTGKTSSPLLPSESPRSFEALVNTLLGGLDPTERKWLECAAIYGSFVPVRLLRAYGPSERTDDEVRSVCENTGVLHEQGHCVAFCNEGVRDVVRMSLSPSKTKEIHRFIVEWLEAHAHYASPEVLADHAAACGDFAKAVEQIEQQGDLWRERDEHAVSAMLFERGARWARAGRLNDAQIRLQVKKIDAHLRAGEVRGVNDELDELEHMGALGLAVLRARVSAGIAMSLGDHDLAVRGLQRALAEPETTDVERFELAYRIAETWLSKKSYAKADLSALEAQTLSMKLMDEGPGVRHTASARVAKAGALITRVRLEAGAPDRACEALHVSLARVASSGDEGSAARLLANLAHARAHAHDTEGAIDFARRALVLAQRAGDRLAAARISMNLGAYYSTRGDTPAAADSFSISKRLAKAIGWTHGVRLARRAAADLETQHA